MKFFNLRHARAQSRCANGLLWTQNLHVPKSGCTVLSIQVSLAQLLALSALSKEDPACQPLLLHAGSSEPQWRQIMLLVFLPEACGVWEEVCSKGKMVTLLHPVMVKGNSRVQLLQSGWFLNTWY